MNREQFIGFMEAPGSLKGDSLDLLEGLLKEFPYCQTARMLYLKTLHNQKSIHYNSQLKITAAYVGNRKNLYQLILQPDLISKINQLEVEVTNEKKSEIKERPPITVSKPAPVIIPRHTIQSKPLERTAEKPAENKLTQNTVEPKKVAKPETVKEKPPDTTPTPAIQSKFERTSEKPAENKLTQNTIEPKKVDAKPEVVKEKPPVTVPTPTIQSKPIETTTKKPLENKPAQNIVEPKQVEAKPEVVKEKPPVSITNQIIENKPFEKNIEKKLWENKRTPNSIEPKKEPAKPQAVKEELSVTIPKPPVTETKLTEKVTEDPGNMDFTDGIEELEQEILNEAISAAIQSEEAQPVIHRKLDTVEPKEKEEKQQSEAVDKTGKHSFLEWLKLVDKNKKSEEEANASNEEKAKLNELVERFLNEEPRIRPKKTEFFSPVNMARLSMIEDWSFVTETLAKVYAKQGNYIKAIMAYENLILKYPEKNAYFAAQIHSLKELKEKNSK